MPIFPYNGVDCVSGGTLFYRINSESQVEVLMQKKIDRKTKKFYREDTGGKSSSEDISIEAVAAREAAEELNGQILDKKDVPLDYPSRIDKSRDYILELIKKQSIALIQPKTGYALFLVYLPGPYNHEFGTKELHPVWNIDRTVEWIKPKEAFQHVQHIHPRIRYMMKFFS